MADVLQITFKQQKNENLHDSKYTDNKKYYNLSKNKSTII